MPRRVRLAAWLPPWPRAKGMARRPHEATWLAFVLHGILIVTGEYRLSFDAYTHMFFADHYRLDWWSLWEPRWYTGFSIVSYPPLVHQLIGLLGHLIGVDAAFAVILWAALTAFPVAAYAFSRAFSGRAVAGYAALGAAVLPSVYLAAHNFGQIPTVTAVLFALFGVAALAEFLRQGDRLSGALALALFTAMMAAHHATLLFLPWVVTGLALHLFLNRKVELRTLLARLSVFLPLAALTGLLVIWPFWAWGRGQSIQVPIDHPTRHNFLTDPFAVIAFFLPVYGPLMLLIPFAVWKGLERRYTGLSLAFLPLFILGLGGTTPLPRWLFGAGWEWLIYDRFALWASLLLLPFFGVAILLLRRRVPGRLTLSSPVHWAIARIKKRQPGTGPTLTVRHARRWAVAAVIASLSAVCMVISLLPRFVPFEPAAIDMRPIVGFLEDKRYSGWRYLTFGFGDQLAYLSRLTTATTLDGDYHTARSLPELRESGIGQIDTAFWTVQGLRSLDSILKKSGGHGVRWGFVGLDVYIPPLRRNGWVYFTTLSNGIQVWQDLSAVPPPVSQPPPDDPLAAFSWGVFPLLSLAIAAALAAMRLRPTRAQKALYGIHQAAIGLLPLVLCCWCYLTIAATPIPNVYFTYTDALFFAGDALGLVAFLSWLIARFTPSRPPPKEHVGEKAPNSNGHGIWGRWPPHRPDAFSGGRWGWALCLLASLSIFWSVDWRVSLYVSLHLWLVFGIFLSLRDRPQAWRSAAVGFCAALVLQILVGTAQFVTQSTAFMNALGLPWPGALDAATPGASVVQLLDGSRWLRAYGTFPHPNILGGMIVAFLAGPLAIFLTDARQRAWALMLFTASVALLVLSFSRSAWLGLAAAGLVLIFHRSKLDRKRLLALTLAGFAGLLLAAAPLYGLIFTRVGGAPVATETFSNEARAWLIQSTLEMIKNHPVLGVGVGGYIVEYARHVPYGYLVEPVHNLPLLVTAELGIPGVLVLAGLVVSISMAILRARDPLAVIFSASLMGLCVLALFDHYLWTLAPGRLLLGLVLGLWAGQVRQEAETNHVTNSL